MVFYHRSPGHSCRGVGMKGDEGMSKFEYRIERIKTMLISDDPDFAALEFNKLKLELAEIEQALRKSTDHLVELLSPFGLTERELITLLELAKAQISENERLLEGS